MRPLLRKLLCAALAAVLLVPPFPVRASEALGHDLAASGVTLAAGTALGAGTFWSDSRSDLRRENYVVYAPGGSVRPVVAYGETSRSLTTTTAAAAEWEARGWRVVAGINGDYYDTSNGLPLGTTMTDGVLRNINGAAYYAVGFRADGSAVIGDPRLTIRASTADGGGFPVFALNYIRHSEYGISLYDHTFNFRHTTGTTESGVDVLCSVAGGALRIGGALTLRVEAVLPDATDTAVPEGMYCLTANHKAGEGFTAPLLALQPGDELVLGVESASGDPAWNEVVELIGAPELLVENGAVRAGLPEGSAPRTAIGQRADGSLIFYTVDGRRAGHSVGATLTMVGMRLAELGCVTAVALDGGGSTTLVATMPDEYAARVVNTPSDGAPRPVSNHVLLVAPNIPSGVPDHVYLAPASAKALPGARVSVSAAVIDTNYIPMTLPVSLTADAGILDGAALYLPDDTGVVTVTASGGGLFAQAAVEAAAPEGVAVLFNGAAVDSLAIQPGSVISLTAVGVLNHLALPGGNGCFAWDYEGDGVTLADAGTLIASADAGAGTLTVGVGGVGVSIPVTVAPAPLYAAADYEEYFEPLVSEDGRTTFSRTDNSFYVHNGRGAARFDYAAADPTDEDAFAASVIPVYYPVASGCDTWSVWYLAEQRVAFDLIFDNGARAGGVEYPAGASGWQLASGRVPEGASAVVGLIGFYAPELASGTIWFDQFVYSLGGVFDTAAPAVSLTLDAETNTLAGRAFDARNGAALPTLRLTYDRAALPFSFDSRTGAIGATLPACDGLAHHVVLTAGDAAGNLSRVSVVIPAAPDVAPAFPDAEGHWASGSIEYLKRAGVTVGDDKGLFHPDASITRQEFAVMLYRYLAPQGDFGGVALPFDDADAIAPWALDAARAMYALGVVNGSRGSGGKLRYAPAADITRREAATMLGRLLEKGYAASALSYADAGEIPSWAAEHVAVLGSLGVFDDFAPDVFDPLRPLTRAEMASMLMRLG